MRLYMPGGDHVPLYACAHVVLFYSTEWRGGEWESSAQSGGVGNWDKVSVQQRVCTPCPNAPEGIQLRPMASAVHVLMHIHECACVRLYVCAIIRASFCPATPSTSTTTR